MLDVKFIILLIKRGEYILDISSILDFSDNKKKVFKNFIGDVVKSEEINLFYIEYEGI